MLEKTELEVREVGFGGEQKEGWLKVYPVVSKHEAVVKRVERRGLDKAWA